MATVIHDLKTERQNISGGLPGIYKIIPIAFILSIVLSTVLCLFFFLNFRSQKASEKLWQIRLNEAKSERASLIKQQTDIVSTSQKAEGVAKWLEGSRPIQPITVAIGRSMTKNSSIAELKLDRNPEMPAHTMMQLKINGGNSGEQIVSTLDAITALNFQTYSANHLRGRNALDFQATLIWNDK